MPENGEFHEAIATSLAIKEIKWFVFGVTGSDKMASPSGLRMVSLGLRVFTLILLFVSLIVLCTNVETWTNGRIEMKFEFIEVKAYQYMLSTIVISLAYILMQTALSIYNFITRNDGLALLDFYGDKLVSYLLATGAAAGYGMTVDGKDLLDGLGIELTSFYDKAYASASLLLIAFICTAITSILSSFALPKTI